MQEAKLEVLEVDGDKIQDMLALREHKENERILRFRAILKQVREETRDKMLQIIAEFLHLDCEEQDFDKVCQVNSRIKKVQMSSSTL